MTTTDATTIELKMTTLRVQVLKGIAAGEVRRVKTGNTTRIQCIQWFKPEGHELGWGRTHGQVFTRWPISSSTPAWPRSNTTAQRNLRAPAKRC